jgi:hypothetical protein
METVTAFLVGIVFCAALDVILTYLVRRKDG